MLFPTDLARICSQQWPDQAQGSQNFPGAVLKRQFCSVSGSQVDQKFNNGHALRRCLIRAVDLIPRHVALKAAKLIPNEQSEDQLAPFFDYVVQRIGCTRIMRLLLATAAGRRSVMETQEFRNRYDGYAEFNAGFHLPTRDFVIAASFLFGTRRVRSIRRVACLQSKMRHFVSTQTREGCLHDSLRSACHHPVSISPTRTPPLHRSARPRPLHHVAQAQGWRSAGIRRREEDQAERVSSSLPCQAPR
jgi:hypothetical protein